jgi:hypothetical protein
VCAFAFKQKKGPNWKPKPQQLCRSVRFIFELGGSPQRDSSRTQRRRGRYRHGRDVADTQLTAAAANTAAISHTLAIGRTAADDRI